MLTALALSSCLALSYPGHIQEVDSSSVLVNGKKFFLDAEGTGDAFDRVSIRKMLSVPYRTDFSSLPQADPGRLRPRHFFQALYGEPSAKDTRTVKWGSSSVTMKKDAAEALEKVRDEIFSSQRLREFNKKSLGSYNKRFIAGTQRYSAHAYALALDLEYPKGLHRYWQWDGACKENTTCRYPANVFSHKDLQDTVRIFEKHGFIWGGRWNHYDTMHFEYRPEIISCSVK